MSEDDKPAVGLKAEKKVAVRFSDYTTKPNLKRMNKYDRLTFIDWMFDHFKDVDMSQSRRTIAKELTEKYRNEKKMLLNAEWVNDLLRAQIIKYQDNTYGFDRNDIEFTVDEACENPTAFRSIKW